MTKDDAKVLRASARCLDNEAKLIKESYVGFTGKWDDPKDGRYHDRLRALARRLREIAAKP